jgi:hypothetical protein
MVVNKVGQCTVELSTVDRTAREVEGRLSSADIGIAKLLPDPNFALAPPGMHLPSPLSCVKVELVQNYYVFALTRS